MSSITVKRKISRIIQRHRRGNPNWTRGNSHSEVGTPIITEFEKIVKDLKLNPEQFVRSKKLRSWADQNKNRCYIPEELLKSWGISTRELYD